MNYKSFIAGAMAFALVACAAGCSEKQSSDSKQDTNKETTAPADTTTAEDTTEEILPPEPVEATDPNTVTFDDGVYDFVSTRNEDKDCASGTISVVELMGNKMLRFADDNTVPLDGKVQKVIISATKLLGSEGAAKVRSIEFDLYAQATADHLKTDDAEGVRAPGWIGGGGGTVTAKDDKWYDFKEFSGGEYNFETSGNVHAVFKFLLADDGQCWSEDMEDANFLIMRWGIANESDMYIDNIVFYDEDGKSIPLTYQKSKMEQFEEAAKEKASQAKAEFDDKVEEAKAESEKIGEEMKAEYEKAVSDMKTKFENTKADFENSEEYERVKAQIAEAEAKINEDTAKAREAIEEVSKAIEEAKKKNS
ncbi:hypothetical protein [Ruminococcus sp.]|uniref:hypothetical protein n=1 Tax=Ruminococcus sp. TaxID=41978 RepID=UPI0025F64666|nr:hypothetical protein [Ruminococcus sp.]MBO4523717.1 hypothetical protein [Ruminococcus sp.]